MTIDAQGAVGATGEVAPAASPAIELRRINKHFGSVHANKEVSLRVARGAIHGIVGENGAGKSTLMSILYGFYQAETGEVLIDGERCNIKSPDEAIDAGIGMVHQHFMLVDTFTVLENIILGVEGGVLLAKGMNRARSELMRLEEEYGLEVDVDAVVGDLPVGLQQRVEILKALYRGAEILILDEPTSVLTPQEVDHLFRIFGTLKAQGKTIILITHKLREIMAITDTVTVMRDGEVVANVHTTDTDRDQLAELMVGRKVLLNIEKGSTNLGNVMLEVEGLSVVDGAGVQRVRDVSFEVRGGEIVGIAGVAGNGQSELAEAIAGIRHTRSGTIRINGYELSASTSAHSVRNVGLSHVPEDRQRLGLVTSFVANESAILGYQRNSAYNDLVLAKHRTIIDACRQQMQDYDVRPPDPLMTSANFSGGNQQKIVVAREMAQNPDILLVEQPTRGLDIGAIEFIHRRLIEMRNSGGAVLMISVELDEIMSLSDRILVMFDGSIIGEVAQADATEQILGLMMAGIGPSDQEKVN